jgi:hypothetical protein
MEKYIYHLVIIYFTVCCVSVAWSFSSKTLTTSTSSTPSARRFETGLLHSQNAAEKSYGKGGWKPPSQNTEQQKGKVFSIQQPQDLVSDCFIYVVIIFAEEKNIININNCRHCFTDSWIL